MYVLALPDLRTNTMGSGGMTALVVGGTLLLLLGVVYVLIVMTEMGPQPISAFPVIFNPPQQQPEPLTPDALELPPPPPPLPPREGQ